MHGKERKFAQERMPVFFSLHLSARKRNSDIPQKCIRDGRKCIPFRRRETQHIRRPVYPAVFAVHPVNFFIIHHRNSYVARRALVCKCSLRRRGQHAFQHLRRFRQVGQNFDHLFTSVRSGYSIRSCMMPPNVFKKLFSISVNSARVSGALVIMLSLSVILP